MRPLACLVMMALGACATHARAPELTTTSAIVPVAARDTDSIVPESIELAAAEMPSARLSLTSDDVKIAAFVDAANAAAVEEAELARRRVSDTGVKDFVQLMYDEHRAARLQQQLVTSSMSLSATPTSASIKLSQDASGALSSLETTPFRVDFDQAYVDLQVGLLKSLRDEIDSQLPAVQSAELKKTLVALRPQVADHLERALQLQQVLSKR